METEGGGGGGGGDDGGGGRIFPIKDCYYYCCSSDEGYDNGGTTSMTVAGRAIQGLRIVERIRMMREHWKDVEDRFNQIASTSAKSLSLEIASSPLTINRSDFSYCIGMESSQLADELIGTLSGKGDDNFVITKPELHKYWRRITDHRFNSRIQFFFDLCQRNMDEKINMSEIKEVILSSASTINLSMTQEEAEEYAALIMEELDRKCCGYIEISQLESLFKEGSSKSSQSTDQISVNSNDSSVSPYCERMSAAEVTFRTYWRHAWVIICWVLACIVLFTWKFIQYRHRKAFEVMGYCLCTAKGAAEMLKFNMALILLPVCRNTVTWLRKKSSISSVIPFNENMNFHKLIAGGIVIGVVLHGGTHLACDFPRISNCSSFTFQSTIGPHFQNHQPSYIEILETVEGATGIAMVVLMAFSFSLAMRLPRRHSSSLPWPLQQFTGFNAFWYSHHLFILVYALLIVHSIFLFLTKDAKEKTTWMYITLPVLLYASERVFRAVRSGLYDVSIIKANTYPGKILSLKLTKPARLRYRSGMDMRKRFLRRLTYDHRILHFLWDDHLSVHIRTLGDWTYQIYNLFQEALVSGSLNFPKIRIDGPYGSPAQDHVKYDIVVLIGLGIGATPFISVVRDIFHGLHTTLLDCLNDEESNIRKGPSKAYLYWVTREQSSFEWFRDVMKEISKTKRGQAVIEMHNFLTSVYGDGDARSALMAAIQAFHYAKNGIDIISGTPVQTHFARPKWLDVFSNLANMHAGAKIGVFYCGPTVVAQELKRLCTKFTTKTTTRFVFHKENF